MISYTDNMSLVVKHSMISFLEHVTLMNVKADNRFRNVVLFFYITGLPPVQVNSSTGTRRYHQLSSQWIETDMIYNIVLLFETVLIFFRRIYTINFIRTAEIQALFDLTCFQSHDIVKLRCVTISTNSFQKLLSI